MPTYQRVPATPEAAPAPARPEEETSGRRSWLLAVGSLLLLFALTAAFRAGQQHPVVANANDSPPTRDLSVILTADPGDMSGLAESSYLLKHLDDLEKDPRADDVLCAKLVRGTLYGQRILLATTGIGHDRAGFCLEDLLYYYDAEVKEILFIGTGGISPMRGGILNSDQCDAGARPAGNGERITLLGDMCVSPFATNWDCQKCDWPDKVDSACAQAPCTLHSRWDLFGDFGCTFFTSTDLADEVLQAGRSLDAFPQPDFLWSKTQAYWGAMTKGTGEPYLEALNRTHPQLWDYTTCAEATSNTFWVGSAYEELSRKYTAEVINKAFKYFRTTNRSLPVPASDLTMESSKLETVAISAMEGTGWMSILSLGEVFLHYPHIPSVNIRGAADYTMPPVEMGDDGLWHEMEWVSGENYIAGYHFAIQTTSEVILRLFGNRVGKPPARGPSGLRLRG